jgi:hypothetical protein
MIRFIENTDAEFWDQYKHFVAKLQTTVGPDGRTPLYFPTRATDYTNATLVNIIKMWHSQTAVWNLMEEEQVNKAYYSRVAMLRSDVVYVTPIDIYKTSNGNNQTATSTSIDSMDFENRVAVVPAFAKWPVNDRMIYGPYEAVKIWASERFERLDRHVRRIIPRRAPGYGMHSERFVSFSLFSAIKKAGYSIQEHESVCFLRARADESVWINDCGKSDADNQVAVEQIITRRCGPPTKFLGPKKWVRQIDCRH